MNAVTPLHIDASPDANGWLPISSEPDTKRMMVLLYYPSAVEAEFDGADYSIVVGLWDRNCHPDIFSGWFQQGTNHDIFEHWAVEDGYVPTHYQPLPKPPVRP